MLSKHDAASKIICALDCSASEAFELVDTLKDRLQWVKVGMTLYYEEGPAIVRRFIKRGLKVFLDLKLFDIPFQVEGAARAAALTGAHLISIHGLGGAAMVSAAKTGVETAARQKDLEPPKLVAITVLTSMDDATLKAVGIEHALPQEVETLAKLSLRAGANGVVCSPLEVARLRALLGPQALLVCPGVRPAKEELQDQKRVATPAKALANGASHLVIGRPLTAAPHPKAAFDAMVQELQGASCASV